MDHYCEECGRPCQVIVVDKGIGLYEYAGAVGNHRDLREVSDCHEARIYSTTNNDESGVATDSDDPQEILEEGLT